MAVFPVLTPGTNVQIIPFIGCDNENGVVVSSCLKKCCDPATGQNPWCEIITVEYDFKACTYCSRQTTDFCRAELIEIP